MLSETTYREFMEAISDLRDIQYQATALAELAEITRKRIEVLWEKLSAILQKEART